MTSENEGPGRVDLDELERLLAAATGSGIWSKRNVLDKTFRVRTEAGSFVAIVPYEQDAASIVALHNSAAAMIAEIRELRAENARLRDGAQAFLDGADDGFITAKVDADLRAALTGEPQ